MRFKSHSKVEKTEDFFCIWLGASFLQNKYIPSDYSLHTRIADSVSHVQKPRCLKERLQHPFFP